MIDLSWLEKALIELILFIVISGGCFLWGDVHRHRTDMHQQQMDIAAAQDKQRQDDNKKIAAIQQTADNLDKEDDNDIAYGAKLEKQLAAEKKKDPLPAGCKLSAERLRIYRSAGQIQ